VYLKKTWFVPGPLQDTRETPVTGHASMHDARIVENYVAEFRLWGCFNAVGDCVCPRLAHACVGGATKGERAEIVCEIVERKQHLQRSPRHKHFLSA
jgi:hypothetical protein